LPFEKIVFLSKDRMGIRQNRTHYVANGNERGARQAAASQSRRGEVKADAKTGCHWALALAFKQLTKSGRGPCARGLRLSFSANAPAA
jgi:hypothetical protein